MRILVPAIQNVSPSTMQSIRLAWPQIVKRAETALPLDSADAAAATVDAALATPAAVASAPVAVAAAPAFVAAPAAAAAAADASAFAASAPQPQPPGTRRCPAGQAMPNPVGHSIFNPGGTSAAQSI